MTDDVRAWEEAKREARESLTWWRVKLIESENRLAEALDARDWRACAYWRHMRFGHRVEVDRAERNLLALEHGIDAE